MLNVVLPEAVYAAVTKTLRAKLGARPELKVVATPVGWAQPAQLQASGHSGAGGMRLLLEQPGEDGGVAFTPNDMSPVAVQLQPPPPRFKPPW